MENPLTDFLSTEQAAEAANISKPTLRAWRRAGKIPAPIRYAGRYLYPRTAFIEALARMLEEQEAAA
ncbi:helix-turn-helix domain-containing protein [Allochromatium humboldtianum]|uniref:Helix-turn-helix domain-containing protein n=1 Tax=Allochromatium humboldtianum TaxID=504901 RepID=A0A850RKU0_9GAMM|nr:helix-turn-helix domain-containing protein [Allochromatium humboldtianum]NVZ11722.1 helix-turn-helix domain-containing protein [Allochromatium humboldtianum]